LVQCTVYLEGVRIERSSARVRLRSMDIPPELVLEILVRLPWTSRRRVRLVCRSWRDLVHHHTTEMQQRREAVPLVVTTESVYVLDDLHLKESSTSVTCVPGLIAHRRRVCREFSHMRRRCMKLLICDVCMQKNCPNATTHEIA
jgi:hypothetical protein